MFNSFDIQLALKAERKLLRAWLRETDGVGADLLLCALSDRLHTRLSREEREPGPGHSTPKDVFGEAGS